MMILPIYPMKTYFLFLEDVGMALATTESGNKGQRMFMKWKTDPVKFWA